jgi:hypothetical protein
VRHCDAGSSDDPAVLATHQTTNLRCHKPTAHPLQYLIIPYF